MTKSEEGHGEGDKGNGDGDDKTINIRWEVGGGRVTIRGGGRWEVGGGRVTKGGVEGDGNGNEDG